MIDDKLKGFGALLRTAREALGLTQEEVGAKARCSASEISKIEQGGRHPRLFLALELLSLLGINNPHTLAIIRGFDRTMNQTDDTNGTQPVPISNGKAYRVSCILFDDEMARAAKDAAMKDLPLSDWVRECIKSRIGDDSSENQS